MRLEPDQTMTDINLVYGAGILAELFDVYSGHFLPKDKRNQCRRLYMTKAAFKDQIRQGMNDVFRDLDPGNYAAT